MINLRRGKHEQTKKDVHTGVLGFLNQYADFWTQGESVEELEKMLVSLYSDIIQFNDIKSAVAEHIGLVAVPA